MKKLFALILSLSILCTLPALSLAEQTTIRLGLVGETSDQWEPVIEKLKAEGITLKLVKFADYSQPNRALQEGEIDLNAFQHYAFLAKQIQDFKFDLSPIGDTIIAPLGLYSKKIKSVDEIVANDKIAIPNDATNGGRAFRLLEKAGLIKLNPEAGALPEKSDISENPLNLEIIEVEAAQTPALLPDVAAAIINGGHAVDNGLYPKEDAIILEVAGGKSDNPFVNIIVARTADKDNPIYQKVVAAYRSPEVAKVIEEIYKGAYLITWELPTP